MISNAFPFELVSSDGKLFKEDIDALYVTIPGYGIRGFLKNCSPCVANLDISIFYYVKNGEKKNIAISGGILDVRKDKTILLAQTFELSGEIDKERALKAKKEAEEKMRNISKENSLDYEMAEISLKKAMNRLKLS